MYLTKDLIWCYLFTKSYKIVKLLNFFLSQPIQLFLCHVKILRTVREYIGPTWLSFSRGNLWCPVHVTGCTKNIINQGANGPLLCSAPARKWRAIPGHPGSPQSPIKEKSDPPGHLGLERVVQSISPIYSGYLYK